MKMRGMMIAALAMLFSTDPLWVAADQNAEIQSDAAGQNKNKNKCQSSLLTLLAGTRCSGGAEAMAVVGIV